MPNHVCVVDCGLGNLSILKRRLEDSGATVSIAADPVAILGADKIVLPGVGHYQTAMDRLRALDLIPSLEEFALRRRRPVLGICLGMQLMARGSQEGHTDGLGWFDAEVVRLPVHDRIRYKVPHVGWNLARNQKASALQAGIPDASEFYFLHSYCWSTERSQDVVSQTTYERPFPSVVQRDNLYGVQFHPEKSHAFGERLLKNFVELNLA